MHSDHPFLLTEESFRLLYLSLAKRLYRLCHYYLRDEEEAREIVQEVFRSLWERRADLRLSGPPEAYLIQSTKNLINRHFRDKSTHQAHLNEAAALRPVSEETTEQMVLFSQLSARIAELVGALPGLTAHVFRLSREQGLGNREIAVRLDISEKAVEYHLTKSLAHLRRNLE